MDMSTLMPEGEAIRRAVQWVSRMKEEKGATPLSALIEEACIRFNLSPKDSDFLNRFFGPKEKKE